MSHSDVTGSFWRCPSCKKHVPSRQNTCRCGFDRKQAPGPAEELRVGAAARAEATDESAGFQWRGLTATLALLLVLAGAGYWAYTSWKTPFVPPEESGLARKIREARAGRGQQQPEVVYVPVPIGQDPKGNQPTSSFPSSAPVSQPIDAESFQTLPPQDRELAERLAASLTKPTPPSLVEIVQAEALFTRHTRHPAVGLLFRSLVLVSADRLTSQRRVPEAKQILERGATLLPSDPEIQRALMHADEPLGSPPAAPSTLAAQVVQPPAAPTPEATPLETETDIRRKQGLLDFERALVALSEKADRADIAWERYLAGCRENITTATASSAAVVGVASRDWIAVVGAASTSTVTTSTWTEACAEAGAFLSLARQVNQGMCVAEDAARRAAVYPGSRRDLRTKYRLDWSGWDAYCR